MENLIKVARELNAARVLNRLERAQRMNESAKVRVAVMGPFNSGKTTLINGILGQEVREPSLLPYDGKPLRISFERGAEDERYDCVYVVHEALCIADVLLFEYAAEKVFAPDTSENWTDEIDFAFYLMPATHFMTATDKGALRALSEAAVPTQVVVTMLDQLRPDERDLVVKREASMCKDAGLSEPILADAENWAGVYRQMFDKLPLTAELNRQRDAHVQAIVQICRAQLEEAVAQQLAQEKAALESAEQARTRSADRAAALNENRARALQNCSRSRDESLRLVQEFTPTVDRFVQEKIAQGQAKGFSKEFIDALPQSMQEFCKDRLESISRKVAADVDWLVKDAVAKGLITPMTAELLQSKARKESASGYLGDNTVEKLYMQFVVNQLHDSSFDLRPKRPKGVDSKLIQTAAVVGAAGIAALVSPMSAPLTGGTIAAAVGLGGLYYYQQSNADQKLAYEKLLTQWGSEFGGCVHDCLEANVREMFDTVSKWLESATAEPAPAEDVPERADEVERLEALARELQK